MVTIPSLVTDRLILRDIIVEDTDLIVKLRSNPEVYKYFLNPHPLTKEEHMNWYHNSYIFNPDRLDFMAVVKNGEKAIGLFGIKRAGRESKEAEVSYILAPEEQGKGYASEAMAALMNYIKTEWNCEKAVAEIHKDNDDSIRFAGRLGYRYICQRKEFGIYEKEL